MDRFRTLLGTISEVQTREAARHHVLDALQEEGARRVGYHAVDTISGTITIHARGFPEEWAAEYVAKRFFEIDPVPELAVRLAKPFLCREIDALVEDAPAVDECPEAMARTSAAIRRLGVRLL